MGRWADSVVLFISYARKDKDVVLPLVSALAMREIKVWNRSVRHSLHG